MRKLVPPSLSRVALRGAIVDLASRGGALHASRLSIGFCTARAALPANLTLASAKVIEPLPEPPKETFQFPILDVPESVAVKSFLEPGSVVRPVPLRRAIFEVALRKDIVLQAVRYTRNKRRQPKRTKRMSELRGSNKKPRPQKGTGMSQVGHRRNSAWVGGQKAHGPVIRDYSIGLNKKQRALALMMALTAKFREGNLFVFDEFAPPVSTYSAAVSSWSLTPRSLRRCAHLMRPCPGFAYFVPLLLVWLDPLHEGNGCSSGKAWVWREKVAPGGL